ncbi:MAG: hypothetical protein A3E88_07970 [Legionellales bacterium RIFCSPHIGHO2_12_FULL_35_11]|nr:MAG: hypothetical protein A3E88_07970 [Legionellales bacterium RIFCSPHIGHO2_12_FULL_35_11]
MLISSLAIIICLICVIGIHEIGHALAAKIFGVKIRSISLGFGKTLFKFKCSRDYSVDIKALPIGGCVHLFNTRVIPVTPDKEQFCFDNKPIWVRIIILLSGSIANVVLAFIALMFMFIIGFKQMPAVIDTVITGSRAELVGLKDGDRITKVAGKDAQYWRDVGMQFIMHVGQKNVPIVACSQLNICHSFSLDLDLWNRDSKNFSMYDAIGFKPRVGKQYVVFTPGSSFLKSIMQAYSSLLGLFAFFFVILKQIFLGAIPFAALLGPFKFFEAVIDSFMQGFATFLYFMGNFSLAMGVANLLPIPGLDGGSVIYALIEKVRGKPISIALEVLIYRLIFIAFAIFIVKLIVNDMHYYF